VTAGFRLDADSEAQLGALLRGLRRLTGFGLYEVIADSAAQKETVRRLRGWGELGIIGTPHVVEADADRRDLLARLDTLGATAALPVLVLRLGTRPEDDALADRQLAELDAKVVAALNLARDRLPRLVSGPLVLLVSPEAAADLAARAVDLLDVRRSLYTLQSEPIAPVAAAETLPTGPRGDPAVLAALHQRDTELRARVARAEGAEAAAVVDAWLGLAQQFAHNHDPAGAHAAAHDARLAAARLGYGRAEADGAHIEAQMLAATGQPEAALFLWRHVTLPRLRELGREREVASVQGWIAGMLQLRGDWDEALRIRREEQLPVYERLGDVRGKAITLGKVADVLQARGQLDEALRILREDVLPAFERMALPAELAWAKGILARAEDNPQP
jgi:hypothetical protein